MKRQLNTQVSKVSSRRITGLAALLMTFTSGLANADDTEVFFGRNSAQPNVLFIFDVSGSMSKDDGTSVTRLDRLKLAMDQLLSTTNDINVGLISYSGYGTNFLHPIQPVTENRQAMLDSIQSLEAQGATPTVTALYQGTQYFSGADIGAARKRSHLAPFHYNCTDPLVLTNACRDDAQRAIAASNNRLPAEGVYTLADTGAIDRHPHCTEDNLGHPSCANEEIVGAASYNSPIVSECQSNHIVLLTDGVPTENEATQATVAEIANDIGITSCLLPTGHPDGGRCGAELTNFMATEGVNASSTVITHTIGLELAGSSAQWLQTLSAVENDKGIKGTHHDASSASSLIEAFEDIVGVAQTEQNTFVAPAITVDSFSGLSHREDVYLGLFKPSARSNWQGNLKRYNYTGTPPVLKDANNTVAIDAEGNILDTAVSFWSEDVDGSTIGLGGAASQLDANNRNVYTHLAGNDLTAVDNKLHEDNGNITAALLNVPAAEREDLLKWTRGVDVLDYDGNASTTTRKQMGDPLHSKPVLVTYGKVGNQPDSVAFIGTNQGYLHAIDTITGEEVFSFVPKELLANLDTFYKDERRLNKLYGLDGDLTTWIEDHNQDGAVSGEDHAYLYAGMRRGGNNYYALDVSDKNNPEVMWTIKGGPNGDADFTSLGQSWSKPTLAKIMVNGKKTGVLIFGGGYDSMQDNSNFRSPDTIGNSLFVVNAETGELLWKADKSNFSQMMYSLPSDPKVIDINGDGLADQVYIGDMGGQVWRFDVNSDATNTSTMFKGGVIASLADNSSNGFRKFFYQPDIAMIAGSGTTPDFLSISIGSGNRAHPLDEVAENSFYMIRQYSILNAPEEYGMKDKITGAYRPIREDDLYNATANDILSSNPTVAAKAQQDLSDAQGWRIELSAPGEKVLSHSLTINNGVNFTTYVPGAVNPEDICSPSVGRSQLYRMHVSNAAPTDGTHRSSDVPGTGIASSTNLFFSEDGDSYIQEGTRTVDSSKLKSLSRTYWSEHSE